MSFILTVCPSCVSELHVLHDTFYSPPIPVKLPVAKLQHLSNKIHGGMEKPVEEY